MAGACVRPPGARTIIDIQGIGIAFAERQRRTDIKLRGCIQRRVGEPRQADRHTAIANDRPTGLVACPR